jgi:aspartate/methionine/tyrosine aminotransferase
VDAIAGNLAICPPAPSQYAAIAAFDAYDECDGHVQRYAANRRLMIDGLAALGITRLAPADGAFYLYADVSDITDDSQALCWDLLDTVGVAAAPGLDFDPVNGHRYLRFSFAGNAETLQGAVEALGRYLATR